MGFPSKNIEPESGGNTPAIMLKIVVLPAPFGPISALMLPSGISNEASDTAFRPRKDLLMLLNDEKAHSFSFFAMNGQMPFGRNMMTASSTTP